LWAGLIVIAAAFAPDLKASGAQEDEDV